MNNIHFLAETGLTDFLKMNMENIILCYNALESLNSPFGITAKFVAVSLNPYFNFCVQWVGLEPTTFTFLR